MKKLFLFSILLLLPSFIFADTKNITVTLTGEFTRPGLYTIEKGSMLSDVLRKARGYTDNADLEKAVLKRLSVKSSQHYEISKAVDAVKGGIISYVSKKYDTYSYKDHMDDSQKRLFAKLENLKPSGIIPVTVMHFRLLKGSEYDIELESGDEVILPAVSDEITVAGFVQTQSSVKYSAKNDYDDYIDQAGGFTQDADKKYFCLQRKNRENHDKKQADILVREKQQMGIQ